MLFLSGHSPSQARSVWCSDTVRFVLLLVLCCFCPGTPPARQGQSQLAPYPDRGGTQTISTHDVTASFQSLLVDSVPRFVLGSKDRQRIRCPNSRAGSVQHSVCECWDAEVKAHLCKCLTLTFVDYYYYYLIDLYSA